VNVMADAKKKPLHIMLAMPWFVLYGAWLVLAAMVRLIRWLVWTVRLMNPEIQCPCCGFINSVRGRWECRAPGCGAVYLGAADRCARCGAGASFFPCANCGASVLLRPGR